MSKLTVFLISVFQMTCLGYANDPTLTSQTEIQLAPARFQEPIPPYPYHQEEVTFQNSSANVMLAGTLTWPTSPGPFPVVILLHGSAPLDRDSLMFNHKFFLVWADYLTKQGIAVLRFDKRSAGKSTGDYDTSTLEDFAEDALAGVHYLKNRKEINLTQIGLIGHSEGGLTALLTASKSNEVAFVVLMAAAPCRNIEELFYSQEEQLQRVDGVSEEMIAKSLKFRKHFFSVLKEEADRDAAEKKLREIFTKYLSLLTPSQRVIAEKYYGSSENQIKGFNSKTFRYWMTYDPVVTLKHVKVPVLALNGELDFVVASFENLQQIAKILEEIGHKDFTVMELPKVNHLFQTCMTGSVTEYADIEETASPLALNKMAEWILEKTSALNH